MENWSVIRYLNGFFLISKPFRMSLDCSVKQEDYFFHIQFDSQTFSGKGHLKFLEIT